MTLDEHSTGASTRPLAGRKIITGVIGDDIHMIGMRLVEHALRAAGATIVPLGVLTPVKDFVDAAIETAADAVFVSSSNGHAYVSAEGIRDAFVEAGLDDALLYIGGNLAVGRQDSWAMIEARFHEIGFDRVFEPGTDPEASIELLAGDLAAREAARA